MHKRVDVTVVGGGPVGLFGAFYAGLRGMSVRIIDSLPELGGQLVALYPEKYVYDMPGFPKVLAKELARQLIAQGTQFGPETVLGVPARALIPDPEGYTIVGSNDLPYPTRTVIIAGGAGAFQPTRIGLPDEEAWEGRGLSYGVRSKAAFEKKRVLIIGGGDSAFDWALNLHEVAASVALVHRRDQFRAHEDTVRMVTQLGVPFYLWRTVQALHGEGTLAGVTLEHTQTKALELLECDAVVVNIGFKSSLGSIKEWGLELEKNQIVVNSEMQTSRPGVYAVGDVCTYPGKLKLIATGVGEAATAVCFAKTSLDPTAKLFPGHSSDLELPVGTPP